MLKKVAITILIIIFSTTIFAQQYKVKVIKQGAKITEKKSLKDVPLFECELDDSYEVIEKSGNWFKVKAVIDAEGNAIEGWISASFVEEVGTPPEAPVEQMPTDTQGQFNEIPQTPTGPQPQEYQQTPSEEPKSEPEIFGAPQFDAGGGSLSSGVKRNRATITLDVGLQNQKESLVGPTEDIFAMDSSLPISFFFGTSGEVYPLNTVRHGLGLDWLYNLTIYKYDTEYNGQPVGNLSSYFHNLVFNLKYRFFITEDEHTLALIPKVGFRYIKFYGSDATDGNTTSATFGQPYFFHVDTSYMGVNVSPMELNYLFPFRTPNFDMGIKASWDLLIKPKYSEESFDFDGDGTATGVTGATTTANTLNHFINGAFYFVIIKGIYAELGFRWYRLGVDATGEGHRQLTAFNDGSLKQNYYNYYLSLGWTFL